MFPHSSKGTTASAGAGNVLSWAGKLLKHQQSETGGYSGGKMQIWGKTVPGISQKVELANQFLFFFRHKLCIYILVEECFITVSHAKSIVILFKDFFLVKAIISETL